MSEQSQQIRDWKCGNYNFGQTLVLYNSTIDTVDTPWYVDCGYLEADATGEERIDGVWDWSWYLNY